MNDIRKTHPTLQIPPSAWVREGATPSGRVVWRAALEPLGLGWLAQWSASFGMGWVCANGNRTELYLGGEPMILARHPNVVGVDNGRGSTWRYADTARNLMAPRLTWRCCIEGLKV